jgi:hypothetical protein
VKLDARLDINQADLNPILCLHGGTRLFANALSQVEDGLRLIWTLADYIQFNSVFGSGVANLAGQIASRQELFRDAEEPIAMIADRSVEVAAHVFFAAIDEYGDREKRQRGHHRALAQATLKGVAAYFNLTPDVLRRDADGERLMQATIDEVREGYGLNRVLDEPGLFRAIGFHIGSEVLADEEFNLLDEFLRANYPDLVSHLRRNPMLIGESKNPAYAWIQIHTSVEANHFQAAVTSASLALRYYAGNQTPAAVKDQILEGFQHFAAAQARFMNGLVERLGCAVAV